MADKTYTTIDPHSDRSLTRRSFIAAAAAAPVVAAAPALAAIDKLTPDTTLANLIEKHFPLWSRIQDLLEQEDRLLSRADKPNTGTVLPREVFKGRSFLCEASRRPIWNDEGIDEAADGYIRSHQWHIDQRITPAGHRRRIAEVEQERIEGKRLLAERKAVYNAWWDATGLTAIVEQCHALEDIEDPLYQQIMNWEPQTIEDARLMAGYIVRLHDGDVPELRAVNLVKRLAGLTVSTGEEA
ncbi:hypothetical protein [Rhizobium sp. BK251]|uniref:hypothetical protein n=1 Tax=Rhizobium sp. BK251 TaxID=2512125 RepID=UPI00104B11B6|nr:hypothetical protein [Rhizobium sp. BK251]TCL70514.1 hypothetical protein EV286_107389 [Rhizobium sp. BK251]